MKLCPYDMPDMRKLRVIIDTDYAAEADDPFAVAHALMTPKLIVKGIIAEHFDNHFTGENLQYDNTEAMSYDGIRKLITLMNMPQPPEVLHGARHGLCSEADGEESEAADFIIREALRDDPHRLFVVAQGALTNIASALLKNPQIANRMTVIWIGGGDYSQGGGREFNLTVDIHAANVVFSSQVPLWQIPVSTYTMTRIGFAELYTKVRPCGDVGRYLYDQMISLNMERTDMAFWPNGESWSLGDSPLVAILMDEHATCYHTVEAPRFNMSTAKYIHNTGNRSIRVYHRIDQRFLLEDLFAKLQLCFG